MSDKDLYGIFSAATDALSQVYVALFQEAVAKTGLATRSLAVNVATPRLLEAAKTPTPKLAVQKKKKAKKSGPTPGHKATPRPCPVTGKLNTYRRFSYLMPEVRTAANLKKFKGWASKTAAAPAPKAEVKAAPKAEVKAAKKPVKKAATKVTTPKKEAKSPSIPQNNVPHAEVTATVFHPSL